VSQLWSQIVLEDSHSEDMVKQMQKAKDAFAKERRAGRACWFSFSIGSRLYMRVASL
jgi:hypothetical protein